MRYLVEKLLLEQPHVFLDMDGESEEQVWDFCAEDKPKTWIIQLIKLYAMKKLETLNDRKNQSTVLYLTQDEVDMFTENLVNDPFFLLQARSCIEQLYRDNQTKSVELLRKYLPDELKEKIGLDHGIDLEID
jgi:hypothetical protein